MPVALTSMPSGPAFRLVPRGLQVAVIAAAVVLSTGSPAAEPAADAGRADDERAILAAAKAYEEALGRGDTKALAALWTPDGDIVDDFGQVLPGRETVSMPAANPAAPRPAIRVTEKSLRFLCADAAIEDGTVVVTLPGGSLPIEGRFSATWVRHGDGWKLAALRESRRPVVAGPEALKELDWMVGDWTIADESPAAGDAAKGVHPAAAGPKAEMSVRWNESHTFLLRELRISPPASADGPRPSMQISQRIGWDPLSRQIRSWAFGSDGSHGEATWTRDGGSWIARTASVRPDGGQTSTLNIYTFDGKDRCTWRSLPTHVGGEHTPPMSVTMIRRQEGTAR